MTAMAHSILDRKAAFKCATSRKLRTTARKYVVVHASGQQHAEDRVSVSRVAICPFWTMNSSCKLSDAFHMVHYAMPGILVVPCVHSCLVDLT